LIELLNFTLMSVGTVLSSKSI